jgi:hypothetical protein
MVLPCDFTAVWHDLMHWKLSIGPEKWPIFGRFLTLFPLIKRPVRRKKNTSNMVATVGIVIDDVTCKSSIGTYRTWDT